MSTNLECHLGPRAYAVAQLIMDGVNFRDLTRSVELFVVSEHAMADKIACENFYNVLSVGDEF